MASTTDHLNQWEHNRRLLTRLEPEFPDWIITVTFYVSLHAVDALLAHDNVTRIVSHDARNDTLKRVNRYQQIYRHYRPLYDLSRRVRYLAKPAEWLPAAEIETGIFGRYLYPLETSVAKLTSFDLAKPPIHLKTAGAG